MNLLLLRTGFRHLRRRPLQSLLCVLGIALGVAVVVAIDLANASASRAFALSTATVAGPAMGCVLRSRATSPGAYLRLSAATSPRSGISAL
jgi:hypothetical protein